MALIHINDTMLSDMYKDAYGSRPRGLYPTWMEEEYVNEQYAHLQEIICDELLREQRREVRAQRTFERRISRYMADFSIDRATALRWEWEADGEEPDLGYWAYQMGFTYALVPMYLAELRNAGVADLYST